MKRGLHKTATLLSTIVLGLILIVGGVAVPTLATENEEIPKEGVTYTLTYPDGTVITENESGQPLTYDDVMEAMEIENWKLLGDGYTSDENGKAVLPADWADGTIRLIETKVPAGYTQGEQSEKTAELKDGSTKFVNPKRTAPPDETHYKITYKLNGGTYKGSTEDIVETHKAETVISIHEAPTRDGYTFDYWKGSEYQPGDKYTVEEDHVFTAQWKKNRSTITKKTTTRTSSPKTGDRTNLMTWSVLLIAATIFLFILITRRRKALINADGSSAAGRSGKLLIVILAVAASILAVTAVYAADGFVINKVDDGGKPVEGAVFDVYGKPDVTWEAIPDDPTPDDPTPETIDITLVKTWDDENDQDGLRPGTDEYKAAVTLSYTIEGSSAETIITDPQPSVTDNGDNTYTLIWQGIAKQDENGVERHFGIVESDIEGYELGEISGDAENGYTVTNSHTPFVRDISGTKTWDDADDQDDKRPDSITVRLLANGTEVDSKDVSAADDWKYEFKNVPERKNGRDITYTITEDAVPDYATEIIGFDIRNSYTPGQTSVTVTKVWDDADNQDCKRPGSVTVNLLADGVKKDEVMLSEANHWSHTFSGLEKKNAGETIAYTVEETDVPVGYTGTVTGDAGTGYTITNTYEPEKIVISGTKTWDDDNNRDNKRPASVTIRLHADGSEVEGKVCTATEAGGWKYEFKDLPKYKAGTEIVYTVTEDVTEDYTATYSDEKNNYDIKNTYTPGKTSVTVEKAWDDNNDRDRIRPESVTVKLFADGVYTEKSATLNAENQWKATFTDLDEYKSGASGAKVEYSVQEEKTETITGTDGPGTYASTITGNATTGFTITNSHTYSRPVYVLIYDPNGGEIDTTKNRIEEEDTADSHIFDIEKSETLGLTHSNTKKVFMGWADEPDASVPTYGYQGKGYGADGKPTTSLGSTVTITSPDREKTVYAVWGTEYKLTFDANPDFGGSGDVPDGLHIVSGAPSVSYTIPDKTVGPVPVRSGYAFQYWGDTIDRKEETTTKRYNYTSSDSYAYPERVELTEDAPKLTLYARYYPVSPAKLWYDTNAGSATVRRNGLPEYEEAQAYGTQYEWEHKLRTEIPTRPNDVGYEFLGWSRDPNADEPDQDLLPDEETGLGASYIMDLDKNLEETLYAVWTKPHRFSITLHSNGGTLTMNAQNGWTYQHYAADGTPVSYSDSRRDWGIMTSRDYPATTKSVTYRQGYSGNDYIRFDATRSGYRLLGWSSDPEFDISNGEMPEFYYTEPGTLNKTFEFNCSDDKCAGGNAHNCYDLYAVWMPRHYLTITFYSREGGTGTSLGASGFDGSYSGNRIFTPLLDYTQTSFTIPANKMYASAYDGWSHGRKFLGWTTDPEGTQVEFEQNGNYIAEDIILSTENCDPACEGVHDDGGISHNALTLYAVWEYRHRFSISFNNGITATSANSFGRLHPNSGQGGQNPKYTEWLPYSEKEFVIPANTYFARPTRSGYEFIGWTSIEGSNEPEEAYALNDDGQFKYEIKLTEQNSPCVAETPSGADHQLKIYAIWEPLHAFGVQFNSNGTSTNSGYRSISYTGDKSDSSPTYFRLPWRPISQTQDTVEAGKLRAYCYDRDGYEFLGWSRDPNANKPDDDLVFDENWYLVSDFTVSGHTDSCEGGYNAVHTTTLYAVWKPLHAYRLRFHPNGGHMQLNGGITGGRNYTQYTPYWSRTPYIELSEHSYTVPAGSIKVYGDQYPGYTFLGWSRDPNATEPDEEFELDSNNYLARDIELNDENTEPISGYTSGGGVNDVREINLYAVWETNHKYQILFDPNGQYNRIAVTGSTNYDARQKTVTSPSIQTDTHGYTWAPGTVYASARPFYISSTRGIFRGWSTDPNDTAPEYTVNSSGMIEQPIVINDTEHGSCTPGQTHDPLVLYAIFDLPYRITYNGNGGSPVPAQISFTDEAPVASSQSFVLADYISDPSIRPKKQDFAFVGWSRTQGASSGTYGYKDSSNAAYESVTSHLSDTIELANNDSIATLYAVWWYEYRLNYVANGEGAHGADAPGHVYSALTSTNAVLTVTNVEPTWENHTFLGWSTNPEDTQVMYTKGDRITLNADTADGLAEMTLYAVWRDDSAAHTGNSTNAGQSGGTANSAAASPSVDAALNNYGVQEVPTERNLSQGKKEETRENTETEKKEESETEQEPVSEEAVLSESTAQSGQRKEAPENAGEEEPGSRQ